MSDRRIWGYVRVSTKNQNYEYQERILKETGLEFTLIFSDKQSGKDFNRNQYQTMIDNLKENDLVVFPSLDRMGRNYSEIIEQWNLITKSKKCDIKIVDMDLLDTTIKGDSLTSQFISDLVLQILSYVSETERVKIQARVKSGLANAKANGVVLGRRTVDRPDNFLEVYDEYKMKAITSAQAMERLGLKKTTFFKLIKEYEQEIGIRV